MSKNNTRKTDAAKLEKTRAKPTKNQSRQREQTGGSGRNIARYLSADKIPLWGLLCEGGAAAVLALVATIVLRLVGSEAYGTFIYDSLLGYYFCYAMAAVLCMALTMVAFPNCAMFREMFTNRWYFLSRMGYASVELMRGKLFIKLGMAALAYFFGLAVGTVICLLTGIPFLINGLFSMAFLGLIGVMLLVMVAITAGCLFYSELSVRIAAPVAAVLFYVWLFVAGCYQFADRRAIAMPVSETTNMTGLSLLNFGALLMIAMIITVLLSARDKTAFYTASTLKSNVLLHLGLGKDETVEFRRNGGTTVEKAENIGSKKDRSKQRTTALSLSEIQRSKKKEPKRKKR